MTTNQQLDRCESTRASGARCSRPVGHDGPHWQDDGVGITAWENSEVHRG